MSQISIKPLNVFNLDLYECRCCELMSKTIGESGELLNAADLSTADFLSALQSVSIDMKGENGANRANGEMADDARNYSTLFTMPLLNNLFHANLQGSWQDTLNALIGSSKCNDITNFSQKIQLNIDSLLKLRQEICTRIARNSSQREIIDKQEMGLRNVLWSRTLYSCLLMCDTVIRRNMYAAVRCGEGLVVTERQHALLDCLTQAAIQTPDLEHLKLRSEQTSFVNNARILMAKEHANAIDIFEDVRSNEHNQDSTSFGGMLCDVVKPFVVQKMCAQISRQQIEPKQLPLAMSIDHTYRRRSKNAAMITSPVYLALLDPQTQQRVPRAQLHAALWLFRLMSAACERKLIPGRLFAYGQKSLACALGLTDMLQNTETFGTNFFATSGTDKTDKSIVDLCDVFGFEVRPMARLALMNTPERGVFSWLKMTPHVASVESMNVTKHQNHTEQDVILNVNIDLLQMTLEKKMKQAQTHDQGLFSDEHVAALTMDLLLKTV